MSLLLLLTLVTAQEGWALREAQGLRALSSTISIATSVIDGDVWLMGTMVRAPLGGELAHSDFVPGASQRTL